MITGWKHTVMKLEGILVCGGRSASQEKLKACQTKYIKNWAYAIKYEDGKLRTYTTFKSSLRPENYLNQVKNFDHRKALTRVTTSSDSLMRVFTPLPPESGVRLIFCLGIRSPAKNICYVIHLNQ